MKDPRLVKKKTNPEVWIIQRALSLCRNSLHLNYSLKVMTLTRLRGGGTHPQYLSHDSSDFRFGSPPRNLPTCVFKLWFYSQIHFNEMFYLSIWFTFPLPKKKLRTSYNKNEFCRKTDKIVNKILNDKRVPQTILWNIAPALVVWQDFSAFCLFCFRLLSLNLAHAEVQP